MVPPFLFFLWASESFSILVMICCNGSWARSVRERLSIFKSDVCNNLPQFGTWVLCFKTDHYNSKTAAFFSTVFPARKPVRQTAIVQGNDDRSKKKTNNNGNRNGHAWAASFIQLAASITRDGWVDEPFHCVCLCARSWDACRCSSAFSARRKIGGDDA